MMTTNTLVPSIALWYLTPLYTKLQSRSDPLYQNCLMDQNLRSQEGSSRQNMLEHNILSSPAENFVFEVDLRLRKKKRKTRGISTHQVTFNDLC